VSEIVHAHATRTTRANRKLLCFSAPDNTRWHIKMLRQLIDRDVAVAYAWPSIDNDLIRQRLHVANAGAVPRARHSSRSTPTNTVSLTYEGPDRHLRPQRRPRLEAKIRIVTMSGYVALCAPERTISSILAFLRGGVFTTTHQWSRDESRCKGPSTSPALSH